MFFPVHTIAMFAVDNSIKIREMQHLLNEKVKHEKTEKEPASQPASLSMICMRRVCYSVHTY